MRSDRLSHEVRPGSFEEILLFYSFSKFLFSYFILSAFYLLLYTFYFLFSILSTLWLKWGTSCSSHLSRPLRLSPVLPRPAAGDGGFVAFDSRALSRFW